MAKPIRQAATLMMAAKSVVNPSSQLPSSTVYHRYRFLGLKRSNHSRFMPNVYVFPGGAVDKADFSSKWLEVFRRRGESSWISDLALLKTRTAEPRPSTLQPSTYAELLVNVKDGEFPSLPPEAALRLTAIRETFEECGILLARPNENGASIDIPAITLESRLEIGPSSGSIVEWQERIQRDPLQFIDLCLELNACPDIWALHEWSSWLTPAALARRFDSIFFICELDKEPSVTCTANEIQDYKWGSPEEFIELFRQREISLPPPQLFEFNRMSKLIETDSLRRFFRESLHPAIRNYFPVRVTTKDGIMFLLPGDDLYPKKNLPTDDDREMKFDHTIEELNRSSEFLNRSCITNTNDVMLLYRLEGNDGSQSSEIKFVYKL